VNNELNAYLRFFRNVKHRNIAKEMGSYTYRKRLYMVYRQTQNISLRETFRRKQTPPHASTHALLLGACGLASAAAEIERSLAATGAGRGWTGDFDPENILVQQDPSSAHATLIFRNVNLETLVESNEFRVIRRYEPPELEGRVWSASQRNVWAFGCFLFELVVYAGQGTQGITNFEQIQGQNAFHKDGKRSRVVASWISKLERNGSIVYQNLAHLTRQMLNIKPENRPSIQEVHMALRYISICSLLVEATELLEKSMETSQSPQAGKNIESFLEWAKTVFITAELTEAVETTKEERLGKITANTTAFEEFCAAAFALNAELRKDQPSSPVLHTRIFQLRRLENSGTSGNLSRSPVLHPSLSKPKQRLLSIGKF
jgi:serine/threonine protein kinase